MGKNIVPEPSLTAAERTLAVIATVQAVMVPVGAAIAIWIGMHGHVWLCALNAACAGFNLRAVLTWLEDR